MNVNMEKMKYIVLFFILFILITNYGEVFAIDIFKDEGVCTQNSESSNCLQNIQEHKEGQVKEGNKKNIDSKSLLKDKTIQKKNNIERITSENKRKDVDIFLFWGEGCPHCKEEKAFLNKLRQTYPSIKIHDFEVWYNEENAKKLESFAKAYGIKATGVPVTFIGENSFIGFSENTMKELQETIQKCIYSECINPLDFTISKTNQSPSLNINKITPDSLECRKKSNIVFIPWLGKIDAHETSLPILTIIIAGLDSFNPCAFFVLFSLLGLLLHARSRKKILLIGSTFVFFSGAIYFLFMSAWLNLFLIMGKVDVITYIAGVIALIISIINIKDYFKFKKGVSLTIPDGAKPKLFDKMRRLLKSSSIISILIGTTILAITANSYELLCTAGFPMVFTRILTLRNLTQMHYYSYLILYNLIYIIPLAIIVLIFTITLGKRNLSEWQGRVLKLVSGLMMLGLSLVLILDPTILSNALISVLILSSSLLLSGIIILITKKLSLV
jgi:glutaredoxin